MCTVLLVTWLMPVTSYAAHICAYLSHICPQIYDIYVHLSRIVSGKYLTMTFEVDGIVFLCCGTYMHQQDIYMLIQNEGSATNIYNVAPIFVEWYMIRTWNIVRKVCTVLLIILLMLVTSHMARGSMQCTIFINSLERRETYWNTVIGLNGCNGITKTWCTISNICINSCYGLERRQCYTISYS